MNVETICKQLRPVFGHKIDTLYFRYRFESNNDRKKRIEQTLLLLYEKNVDQLLNTSKVLLPPPHRSKTAGTFRLGEVIYDGKVCGEFGLDEQELLRHLGIWGMTGSGKSTIVFKLIDELMTKGVKVFILDWKKQYRDYLLYNIQADVLVFGIGNKHILEFEFNPLIPPPVIDPLLYFEHVAQNVCSALYVGEGVVSLLRDTFQSLYAGRKDGGGLSHLQMWMRR